MFGWAACLLSIRLLWLQKRQFHGKDNCEQTFEQKDKEADENGDMIVRGSRDFIKEMTERIAKKNRDKENKQIRGK